MRDKLILTLAESEGDKKQQIWKVFNTKYMNLVGIIFYKENYEK